MSRVRVGVMISGSGTNLQALLDATADPDHPAQIAVVGADRHKAGGLDRARRAGVPTFVVLKRDHADRAAFDLAVTRQLEQHAVQWVCHAGYMKIVGAAYLARFPQRILNIHPSLLPAFPGLRAQQQAFDAGVRLAGCTVHIADVGIDQGPIVAQGAVPVLPDDSPQTLQQRILRMEHRLYPMVLRWAAQGRIAVVHGRVTVDLPPGDSTHLWAASP